MYKTLYNKPNMKGEISYCYMHRNVISGINVIIILTYITAVHF